MQRRAGLHHTEPSGVASSGTAKRQTLCRFSRKVVTSTFIPALYSARLPGAGRILCMGKGHCWRVILDDTICYKRNSKHRTQISSGKCVLDKTLSNNAIMGTKRSGPVFGHKVHAALKSSSSSVIYRNKAIISITPQVPCWSQEEMMSCPNFQSYQV